MMNILTLNEEIHLGVSEKKQGSERGYSKASLFSFRTPISWHLSD